MRWHDALVAFVDQVTDGLADEMAAECEALEAVLLEQNAFGAHIAVGLQCFLDVEVVAPAGQFQSVIAHRLGERREFGQRQVSPLSGKECDWSGHGVLMQIRGFCTGPAATMNQHNLSVPVIPGLTRNLTTGNAAPVVHLWIPAFAGMTN